VQERNVSLHHRTARRFIRALPVLAACVSSWSGCAELASDNPDDEVSAEENPAVLAATVAPTTYALAANGTGCKSDTWSSNGSSDPADVVFSFLAFEASISPPTKIARSNCQIVVPMTSVPAGFQYAVKSVLVSAEGALGQPGTDARLSLLTSTVGTPGLTPVVTTIPGNFYGVYEKRIVVPNSQLAWSPCGLNRDLQIGTDLRVTNTSGNGLGSFVVNRIGNIEVIRKPCS
jgi:hypothetical protein